MIEKLLDFLNSRKRITKCFLWFILLGFSFGSFAVLINFFLAAPYNIAFTISDLLLVTAIFLLLITGHELGHLLGAKIVHVPTGGIWFLPFLGAVAVIKKDKREISRFDDFVFSIAGPIAGLGAILVSFFLLKILFPVLKDTFVLALLMINFLWSLVGLYNLLPIYPMDGGRVFLDLLNNNRRSAQSVKHIGWLLNSLISAALIIFGLKTKMLNTTILLTVLLWLTHIFLLKGGKVATVDIDSQNMSLLSRLISVIIYLGTISGYIWLIKITMSGGL